MKKKPVKIALGIFILLLVITTIYVGVWFFIPAKVIRIDYGEDQTSIWADIKPFGFKKLIYKTSGYKIGDLKDSPNKRHLAYFDSVREKIYEKEWFLKIIDTRTLKVRTIFIGPWRTSFYKWIDNDTVRVYLNGGTGVRIYRDIRIDVPEPFIAADHMEPEYWIPEKTF